MAKQEESVVTKSKQCITNSNKKKAKRLGMPYGTAAHRIRKTVMFQMAQHLSMDTCFRCGEQIKDITKLNLEHKVAWLDTDDPVSAFFNLSNVAFSHAGCISKTS